MRSTGRTVASALLPLAAMGLRAVLQVPPSPPPAMTAPDSTLAGVYTAQQARRGEETYMSICVGCHSAGTYVGPEFVAKWSGRPLSDLFEVMAEQMPKDDPGSLEAGEYAQVIAYLLRQNKMPAGKSELPADPAALKKITFEAPKSVERGGAEGTGRWRK